MRVFAILLVVAVVARASTMSVDSVCHMTSERIRSALDGREYGYWNGYMGDVAYSACISHLKEGEYPFGDMGSAWQLCNYIAISFLTPNEEGFTSAAEIARSLCIAELWSMQCSCRS